MPFSTFYGGAGHATDYARRSSYNRQVAAQRAKQQEAAAKEKAEAAEAEAARAVLDQTRRFKQRMARAGGQTPRLEGQDRINQFGFNQYRKGSQKWQQALIKFLWQMKKEGHNVKIVETDKVLRRNTQ